ncbi:hypothetical protein GIB67_028101, partial [Kingdonia uniflora]
MYAQQQHILQPQQQQHQQAFVGGGFSGGDENKMIWASQKKKRSACYTAIIGGGPTGVEFNEELSDFIMKDVNEIMSSFDIGLSQYGIKHLTKCGVHLKKGVVKEVLPKKIVISDRTDVPIWPAENEIEEDPVFNQNYTCGRGIARKVPKVEELTSALKDHDLFKYIGHGNVQEFELKSKRCNKGNGKKKVLGERKLKEDRLNLNCGHRQIIGSFVINDGTDVPIWPTGLVHWSRIFRFCQITKSSQVLGWKDVFALGDYAGFLEKTGEQVLPALAQ